MPDTNPFDALDDTGAVTSASATAERPNDVPGAGSPATGSNPFDALDEKPTHEDTAARMHEVTDQADMPEVTVSAKRPRPLASWSDVAAGIPTAIGAGIESKVGGAQEFIGRTAYDDARKKFWQATILPDAVRNAKAQNVVLGDLPEVQEAARHLGIRTDVFTRDWPTYVNQSDDELNSVKTEQRDRIQAGAQQIASGTRKRLTAQQVQEAYAPNMDEHSLKALVFDAATMAPDVLAGVGGAVATGGVGGAAIMAADIAPNMYAEARNRGLDHNQASTYAVLSTLASSVPEVPVLKIVENTPLAKKVIGGIVGEKLASTGAGKVAGTAAAQGVTQSVVNALQQGINAGVLNEHLPLDEALKQVAWSGLVGGVVGAPMGAYHAATTRERKPTTFQDFPGAGGGNGADEAAPGLAAGEATPEEEQAPSVAPPSVERSPTPIDTSGEGNGPEKTQKDTPTPEDERAALEALKTKTITPPQTAMLEELGLVRRNDLGEPMLLPKGRRRITQLHAEVGREIAPTVTPTEPAAEPAGSTREAPGEQDLSTGGQAAPEDEKQAEIAPVEAQNEPETPVSSPEPVNGASKSALMEEKPAEVPQKAPQLPSERAAALQKRLSEDEDLRAGLTAMKGETGWAQVGGRVLRDATTDQVTGRTTWIPNADWWPGRPKGLKETEVHAAVDKAIAGQPLKKRELDLLEYMADVHSERVAMAQTHQELLEAAPDLHKQPEGSLDLTLLASRAAEFDPNEAARIMDTWEDDKPETIARLRGEFEQIIGRGHGSNKEALELTAQDGGSEQSAPAKRTPAALDLFGEERTREQALADETRRRDALRSPNRDVPIETGLPGDLFSQSRRQVDFTDQLKQAREDTETEPTQGQKEAGNYAKGEIPFGGMKVSIENPKGSTRRGVDANGKAWASKLAHDYGYINRTEGHDGDHVDAFLTGKPDTGKVFVVNQIHPDTGKFDEHKAILGAASEDEARKTYEANYPKGWKGEESIAEFSTPDFRKWVHSDEPARGPIRPPSQLERRSAAARRAKVSEMTPEQLRKELLTHELTGIPNRRAYHEAEKLPHQVSIDVDSLKWVNDNMGHESGNEMLKAIASSLSSHSDNVFHLSGDEFAAQSHTETEAHELMREVAEHLKGASIEVEMPDGRVVKLKGLGVSYGVGKTLEEADAALGAHKARRQAEGARAGRGETPPGAVVRAREEGRQDQTSGAAKGVEPKFARKKGEKLTLFHGFTKRVVTQFRPGKAVYLAFDKGLAKAYGEDSGGHVATVDVHLENPLRLETGEQVRRVWEESRALKTKGDFYPHAQEALNKWARNKGHDGIIIAPSAFEGEDGYEWAEGTFGEPQVVVFDGSKVKIRGKGDSAEVKENAAEYSKGVLLSPERGVEAGARRQIAPGQGSLELFAPAENPVPTTRAARAIAATRLVETGYYSSGIKRITRWQDAAHVIAPLRKQPQESLLAVVTDHAGNVLSVIRHTTGTSSASHVQPAHLVGAIARVPGAADVWFAHNHPSGSAEQSLPDNLMTHRLQELMRHSGITPHGMIVVTPGTTRATHYTASTGQEYSRVTAAARRGRVPIQERRYQVVRSGEGQQISTTADAEKLVVSLHDESGLVLLDAKLGVVGHISVPYDEMQKLRTGTKESGTARILAEVEKANTTSAIVYGDRKRMPALANLGQMLHLASVNLVDTVSREENGHWSSNGRGIIKGEGQPFFRRGESEGQGLPRAHVERIVHQTIREANLVAGFPHVEVHEDVSSLPEHIKNLIEQQGAEGLTGAVYDPSTDRIHIVASNNGSDIEVRENLWHEAVGHHGLRLAMDQPQYNAIMDGIARDMPERVEAAARRNSLDLSDLTQKRAAAEEVVAYAAGQHLSGQAIDKPVLPYWQRAVRAVKAFFSRITGKPFYDDTSIAGLIQQAHQALERGSIGSTPGEPMRATRAPTYYSPVERAITSSKQAKASADQWLATIKKMPGVKPEELEWLNLEPWLKEHKGPITRDELADYVRANKLELQETLHGTGAQTDEEKHQIHVAEQLRAKGYKVYFDNDGYVDNIGIPREGGREGFESFGVGEEELMSRVPADVGALIRDLDTVSTNVAIRRAAEHEEESVDTERGTKYSEYTLPGGQNYRELLLRLPDSPTEERQASADDDMENFRLGGNQPVRAPYSSSHWDEPNIVAHTRFTERTDADGKKVLFIEEIQSDWHQAGRKHGYQSEMSPEHQQKLKAIDEKISQLRLNGTTEEDRRGYFRPGRLLARGAFGGTEEVLAYHPGPEGHEYRWSVDVIERNSDGTPKPAVRARNHATDPAAEIIKDLRAQRRLIDNELRVPNAPFKTSWPMLAMKRMVRWAAEKGFDRVAWTTGDQQNERYSLEHQVESVRATRQMGSDGPMYWLGARHPEGGEVQGFGRHYREEELPEVLGEELAAKIRAQPLGQQRTYSGLDLRTGGEGMRGFYDQILPRETDKLIKKYGGKVGHASVGTRSTLVYRNFGEREREELERLRSRDHEEARGALLTETGQRRLAELARMEREAEEIGPLEMAPAHGFDITPEMKQAALGEGFPMFSRRQQPLPLEENRERGAMAAVRRAVNAVHESKAVRDVRKLGNPVGMSPESKQVAQIARSALGELAHETVQTQEALEQFSRQIDRMPIQDQLEMMDAIERGVEQPNPELQPVADEMRKTLDTWRDKVRGLGDGYLDNFIENYFPHYWRDASEAQRMVASIMGRRPLRGPASFLKMRTIPSIKEGMDAGLTPLTTNPLIMTLLKAREMQRFVTGVTLMRRFKEDGLARFLPAGKPMTEGWAPINDNIAKVRQWSEVENGFIERGQYIMPVDAARVINNHLSGSALRDFAPAQIFRRGANALNAMQLGFSAFHLGFTTLDAMISKNAQGIERLMHGDAAGAARSFGEGVTPVGAVRNVRRGYKLLQAYSNPAGATPEMQKLVNMLELAGGRAHMDRYYLATEGFSPFRGVGVRSLASDIHKALTAPQGKLERLGQAVGSFPAEYGNKLWKGLQEIWLTTPAMEAPLEITGRIVRASTAWIMEHLVPMQKLGVFSDLAADHLKRNPIEDPNERAAAMQRIWDSVDNRLGEMVYDNLFWNRTLKDTLHLGIRAVGWNLGTIREIGGAPVDLVKAINQKLTTGELKASDLGHRIPYVLAMTATTALYASIYQYLATGQGPQELKDYFFPRTGGTTNYGTPQRVSLPSYVKDVYEYAHHPGQTVVNKLNPIFSLIGNLYSNQDFFGNPITDPEAGYWQQKLQQLAFIGKEATPFSFQGRQQMQATEQGGGLGATVRKVLPMVGVTPAPGYITSPEQIERRNRLEQDKKYTSELKYKMKQALLAKDKEGAKKLASEYDEAVKRMGQTQKLVDQDKGKAAAARRKATISMRQAGLPATANLVASLPLDPDNLAREYFARQAAASS